MAAVAMLGGCESTGEKYQSPPTSAERAVIYSENPEPFSSYEWIVILEIDRLEAGYGSPKEAWQQSEVPESVDIDHTRAWAVSAGNHKLLIGVCRANYIPLCDYKCSKAILRLDAKAGGVYRIRTDVDDDESKFRIFDVRSGVLVAGPVKEDSNCSIYSRP
jgi:hypothetical protein